MTLDELKAIDVVARPHGSLLYLFRHLTADEMETDPQLAFFYAARIMLPRLIAVAEAARIHRARLQPMPPHACAAGCPCAIDVALAALEAP